LLGSRKARSTELTTVSPTAVISDLSERFAVDKQGFRCGSAGTHRLVLEVADPKFRCRRCIRRRPCLWLRPRAFGARQRRPRNGRRPGQARRWAVTFVVLGFLGFANEHPSSATEFDAQIGGPTGIRAADPSVVATSNGFISVESNMGRAILVRAAASLRDLSRATPVMVWTNNRRLGEVWAPHLSVHGGHYEILFSAGDRAHHRMYLISSLNRRADTVGSNRLPCPRENGRSMASGSLTEAPITLSGQDGKGTRMASKICLLRKW
jgi:hypothetical protein